MTAQPQPAQPTLASLYQARLANGWKADAVQAAAVARLEALIAALGHATPKPPRGLWLFGPPGRGKSQLLDLFMTLVPLPYKRRVHFHAFMEEIHRRLHAMPSGKGDPLNLLATEIATEACVLGFDEFYITNIADAMLLGRLMKFLFKKGVVVVATSNWDMPDLFQGGVNRDRFLPFLTLMQQNLQPVDLRQGPDWRLDTPDASIIRSDYLITQPGQSPQPFLEQRLRELAQGADRPPLADWHPRLQQGCAIWLTFAEACDKPRSRGEYANLVRGFNTILIEGVPQLTAREADAALRFATLIDIIYEQNRQLVISAAVPAHQICTTGDAAQVFQRTASRLVQLTHRHAR